MKQSYLIVLIGVVLAAATLFDCLNLYGNDTLSYREQVIEIQKEIEDLSDLKNRYEASAARHDDEGMRWQFMQNEKQEAKKAFQLADRDREMIKALQNKIDQLEAQKAEILKKHPEANAIEKST